MPASGQLWEILFFSPLPGIFCSTIPPLFHSALIQLLRQSSRSILFFFFFFLLLLLPLHLVPASFDLSTLFFPILVISALLFVIQQLVTDFLCFIWLLTIFFLFYKKRILSVVAEVKNRTVRPSCKQLTLDYIYGLSIDLFAWWIMCHEMPTQQFLFC